MKAIFRCLQGCPQTGVAIVLRDGGFKVAMECTQCHGVLELVGEAS